MLFLYSFLFVEVFLYIFNDFQLNKEINFIRSLTHKQRPLKCLQKDADGNILIERENNKKEQEQI